MIATDARARWKPVLLATLLHVGMLALWPLVRFVYAPAFRALAQVAVNVVDPLPGPIEARFEPGSGGAHAADVVRMDTIVRLRRPDMQGNEDNFGASSFFHGYLPTTVLLALFVAMTPHPARAGRALALAMLLLHLFLAARCILAVFFAFSRSTIEGRPVLELGPASQRVLFLVWHFAWGEMLANYLVPLLVFGLCMFGPRSRAESQAQASRPRGGPAAPS